MSSITILRSSPVQRSPRVAQVEGIFDLAHSTVSEQRWTVNLNLPDQWNIGVIVGPSGAGKSTVARELFGDRLIDGWQWDADKSLLDGFPAEMGVKEVTELLSSVGFSSPPAWLRPFHVLSNGEQFRVNMARTLAEMPELAVVDEFTSVVDRNVAQIGSAAIAKTVRRLGQKLVAVSCHYDILDWLEPDWIYEPHIDRLQVGRSRRRPEINLEVCRVDSSAWAHFRKHHYLSHDLAKSARCFCAFWNGVPVAFTAVLHFPHAKAKNIKREHRTVCLPDFQGVGIGNAMSAYIASLYRATGYRYMSQTSHPAMIRARNASPLWVMTKAPTYKMPKKGKTSAIKGNWLGQTRTRLIASFEYMGPPASDKRQARRIIGGSK